MEEEILLLLMLDEDAKNEEKLLRRSEMRNLRDKSNPFTTPEVEFLKNFRLCKGMCLKIMEDLRPHDTQKTSLPFHLRFLAALNFYGHGSYQKCVGNNYSVSMSQPSISRTIKAISRLLINAKSNEIRFPQSVDDENVVKSGYYNQFGIKGTIGAIDCTHIAIISPSSKNPSRPLSLYMNRKGFYSINMEAVCDNRLVFTFINAKFPGATHDSGIWATSTLREHLINSHHHQARHSFLIGDQGYPLEPWLLTPLANPSNGKEIKYNKLHASARNTIERAFGVLKTRFRCLGKHRVLHYSHESAAEIISACVILHNIIMKSGANSIDPLEELESVEDEDVQVDNSSTQYSSEGEKIRKRYISSL